MPSHVDFEEKHVGCAGDGVEAALGREGVNKGPYFDQAVVDAMNAAKADR